MPPGLTLSANGVLSGTPTASGSFNFTARTTDVNSCIGTRAYAITINCATIAITPNNLSDGRVSQPYSSSFTASGGAGLYTYAVASGALPTGLSLNNGVFAGTPTQVGTFTFTVKATDTDACNGVGNYSVMIKRGFVRADFDGDGKTDFSVWDGPSGNWRVIQSSNSADTSLLWGTSLAPYSDVIVPGDYDGDGKADHAIWRGGDSIWYIRQSSNGQAILRYFGANYALYYDVPVPGDYDGDGKTDIAVWRPTTGYFYVLKSSDNGYLVEKWGNNGDTPVPGDYDGDGITDFACWRSSTGVWLVKNSSGGTQTIAWGAGYAPYFDVPVQADYDGDGKTDLAIWRGGNSIWYIRKSSDGQAVLQLFGANYAPYFDVPVPGDYDGDGKADIAVWRPTNGMWYVLRSKVESALTITHGQQGDTPVPTK